MERKYSATEARANFSQLLTEAGYAGRETVIQRNNRPNQGIDILKPHEFLRRLRS